MGCSGMRWGKYLQRMVLEVTIFFLAFAAIIYFATGQDSVLSSIYMGIIASIFYAGTTYILRERTISRQRDSR